MELIVTGSSSDQKFGVELPDFVWIRRLRISFDFERSRFRGSLSGQEEFFPESFGFKWSSYQGRMGDVLVSEGDEGRGSLRKAWGS